MIKNHFRMTMALSLSFVAIFVITSAAQCGMVSVFGPKQYTRTKGATNIYTDNFQSMGGDGSLVIRNGNEEGTDGSKKKSDDTITSGKIYVNGNLIFGPSDFKSSVYFMEKPVELRSGINVLQVELSSSPGSYITAEVTCLVASVVTLNVTAPLDAATLYGPHVDVQGTVANSAGVETGVVANGVIASVIGDRFIANNVPLQEGPNMITVSATDIYGTAVTKTLTVNAIMSGNFIQLAAYPSSGTAPRKVSFFVSSALSNSILNYQMDFNGDGTADYSGPSFDNMNYTYTSEGIFSPQITVTDNAGNSYASNTTVMIQTREQLEMLLEAKWDQMRSALMAGNIEAALMHFMPGNRDKYRQIFAAMGQAKVNSIFSAIDSIHLADNYGKVASCGALRRETGGTYSYPLRFVQDRNGIWKIYEF